MINRPILLVIFAFYLILDPILRIAFIAINNEFTFVEVLFKSASLTGLDFFNFWMIFPISGLLLLSIKAYSYFFFVIIQFYSLYFHINYESFSWPYLSATPSTTAYVMLFINSFMLIYLLMPRSREVFFDVNLRWWERGSRYNIEEACFITINDNEIHGELINLAFGGALVALNTDQRFYTGDSGEIDFNLLNNNYKIDFEIVRILPFESGLNYGIQFNFKSKIEEFRLKILMLSISKIGKYLKDR